jgi:hypothetical protein
VWKVLGEAMMDWLIFWSPVLLGLLVLAMAALEQRLGWDKHRQLRGLLYFLVVMIAFLLGLFIYPLGLQAATGITLLALASLTVTAVVTEQKTSWFYRLLVALIMGALLLGRVYEENLLMVQQIYLVAMVIGLVGIISLRIKAGFKVQIK